MISTLPKMFQRFFQVLFLMNTYTSGGLIAQNLVPNPNFELYDDCPPYPGQIQLATDWDAPNSNTTDYFHRCSPQENGAGVPENLLGKQEPFEGNAYVGIRTWIPTIAGNPVYREYLSTQLLEPLVAGQAYEVSFMLSLAETSGYLSNEIGLFLSSAPFNPQAFYNFSPQLSFQSDEIFEDTQAWQKVSTIYVAQGGEQYLMIGNFLDDENMKRITKNKQSPLVYYYIDYVEVNSCLGLQDRSVVVDTTVCEGTSIILSGTPGADGYQWDDRSTFSERVFEKTGRYQVLSNFGCYKIATTYNIKKQNCDCSLKIPSPQLAHSNLQILPSNKLLTFQIQVFNSSGQFLFQLSDQDPDFSLLVSGIYYWKGQIQCERDNPIETKGRFILTK